ncbi:MAG: ATP-dependent DNA helicase [bacterium]
MNPVYKGLAVARAGAGTGKTTYLIAQYIEKINFLISGGMTLKDAVKAVLAVTFTRKATGEMKNRAIGHLNDPSVRPYLQIFTIDSFCGKIIREFPHLSGIDSSFGMLLEGDENIFFRRVLSLMKKNLPLSAVSPKDLMAEKELYKFITHLRYALFSTSKIVAKSFEEGGDFPAFIGSVYEIFVRNLSENSVLDFPQLLLETYKLLAGNSLVCEQLRRRYRFVFIDEFQDTSALQLEIFKKIKPEFLCVVGDFNQSIYSFRGASPENISLIDKDADYRKVLSRNHRSTKNILAFVNKMGCNLTDFSPLLPEDNADEGDKVKVAVASSRAAEARYIAEKIKKIKEKEGLGYGDFAVILRSLKNAVSDYERVFREEGIPYITTAGSGFYDRPEVRAILSILKAVDSPCDDGAFLELLTCPVFSFTLQEIYEISVSRGKKSSLFEGFLQVARGTSDEKKKKVMFLFDKASGANHGSLCQFVLNAALISGLFHWINRNFPDAHRGRASANIKKFLELVLRFEKNSVAPTLSGFIDYVKEVNEQGVVESEANACSSAAVEIFTIHKIKGLERKIVFVANITPRQFPSGGRAGMPWEIYKGTIRRADKKGRAKSDKISPEEWRLFYVSATRAREKLFLLGSERRKKLSPLLDFFLESNAGGFEVRENFRSVLTIDNIPPRREGVEKTNSVFTPEFSDIKPADFFSEDTVISEKTKKGFTVTELATFEKCPRRYYFENIMKTPVSRNKESLKKGNVFHQSIEFFKEGGGEKRFRERVSSSLKDNPAGTEKMVSNFLKSRFTEEPFMKEASFTLKIQSAGDFFIKGAIDRVEKTSSGFVIYDYKTNKNPEVAPYALPMNVYALGCEEILKLEPVTNLRLFFLYTGEIKEVELSGKKEILGKLSEILNGIIGKDFRKKESDACEKCPFQRGCNSVRKEIEPKYNL